MLNSFLDSAAGYLALSFIIAVGCVLLVLAILFLIDVNQTKHTIRRNYPVIGRFRYLFEHLGEFFRQYFFAMDREELPFNRAIRNWVYKASKDLNLSLAFGSTHKVNTPGEPVFSNAPFPLLEEEAESTPQLTIGESCREPYSPKSVFNISGMSYGALSKTAVKALSEGAALANCWMNTGEGGLSPYHLQGNCDIVFQIGTANYGVRDKNGNLCLNKLKEVAENPQVKMFEIKLSQGAKPGKGGVLPGEKVSSEISAIRGIPVGQTSYSPNRRADVSNNEELLDLIASVRSATGKPVGIKAVMGSPHWITELCQTIIERGADSAPDFITVDGAEGGSGAAPQPLFDFVGLPLAESLPAVVDELKKFKLRDRVKVIASGKLISPSKAAYALAIGADYIASARGFMFSLGCIQALQCNKNTCPTGITTHNPRLQKGLDAKVKSVRVANYHNNMVASLNLIAHSCGAKHIRALSRQHLRVIGPKGVSVAFDDLLTSRSY